MKFTIQTPALKQALDIVQHATASVSTTPILESILIKVHFSNIVFTANNLEMAIEHVVKKDIKIESEGSFCVPSKIFINYVNLLEDDSLSIELLGDNSLELITQSSKIKIKGVPASDFPLIPTIKGNTQFSLSGDVLKKAIEKTLFSSAEGNIRPTLAGIYMNISGKNAKFATTDSFRMSEYSTPIDEEVEDFSQIIPSRTASELKSLLGSKTNINILAGDNQIGFIFGETKLYSRLLNGKFPDYEGFFPTNSNSKIVVNRYDLIQAMKKINLLSRESNYSIKMSLSKETGILIETSQTQSGEAHVTLVGTVDGDDAIIGLNSEYLLQALGVIDTTHISLSFESPLAPILIVGIEEKKTKDSLRHIIMPLKI